MHLIGEAVQIKVAELFRKVLNKVVWCFFLLQLCPHFSETVTI